MNAFILLKSSNGLASYLENNLKLLKVCADTRNLKLGQTIHAFLTRRIELGKDVVQTNALINLYAKCGQTFVARNLFELMSKRNVVSWSALMAGYFHSGFASEVLSLFSLLAFEGSPRLNKYVFATVLSACSDMGSLNQGRQCHTYTLKSGLEFHSYVKNALIHMYSRCSGVEDAINMFISMTDHDICSYNSMLLGFVQYGYSARALEILRIMVQKHVEWDEMTYLNVLGLCSRLKCLSLGMEIHAMILRGGFGFNTFTASAIVDMYGKCGKVLSAKNAFGLLFEKNVVSWTAFMDAYYQNGDFEETLNLFSKMVAEGIHPNEYTYAIILNSCASLPSLRHGSMLNAHVEKKGFISFLCVGNALINMYAKSGSVKDAEIVFNNLDQRDLVSWNSMINGFSHHGLGQQALKIFKNMLLVGETPDDVTFIGVLSACGHLGLVRPGFYYLNELMKEMGIQPRLEHQTCVVGILSKAGLLDEAYSYMKTASVSWDIIAWRTLLNGSLIHGNFGLGRKIADFILPMDPKDTGTYVLLSNIYAKSNRWDCVVKIRKLMRDQDIKKEPGVSWIQVNDQNHVFISGDKKHPQSEEICFKLKNLIKEIKGLGYVPDISIALQDVGNDQKEENLSYHSEKLAVAFGLISLPFGSPILIIKNLRICEDCHTFMKLISNVTSREIVVRDANRFHCFQSGHCTCGDYW